MNYEYLLYPVTCPILEDNPTETYHLYKGSHISNSGVKMNDACLPTPCLQSGPPISPPFTTPSPSVPPRKTFVFRGWQWGICHSIHYDMFYICSKKPGLNYTGELLKTALNAIIIYCISNSLQQLITLLNRVFFFLIPYPEINSPCNELARSATLSTLWKRKFGSWKGVWLTALGLSLCFSGGGSLSLETWAPLLQTTSKESPSNDRSHHASPFHSVSAAIFGCHRRPPPASQPRFSQPCLSTQGIAAIRPCISSSAGLRLPNLPFTWNPASALISLADTFSVQTLFGKHPLWAGSPSEKRGMSSPLPLMSTVALDALCCHCAFTYRFLAARWTAWQQEEILAVWSSLQKA